MSDNLIAAWNEARSQWVEAKRQWVEAERRWSEVERQRAEAHYALRVAGYKRVQGKWVKEDESDE